MRSLARKGVWVTAALLLTAGCSKKQASNLTAPPPPPQLSAVFPAPRSTHVLFDTRIWAEFSTALDPATVSSRTVFLKIDTQRAPIVVAWDPGTRRILITPTAPLALFTTYTVELSTAIKTADGIPFPDPYLWQFSTVSVQRPRQPQPADGVVQESPFVMLSWGGNETTPGTVTYQLYAGDDSVAVASHVPLLQSNGVPFYLPRMRWTSPGVTHFWLVRAINTTLPDTLDGPVWRFETEIPSGVPTTNLAPLNWAWNFQNQRPTSTVCNGDQILSGPGYHNYFQWSFGSLPPNARLADAYLEMSLSASNAGLDPLAFQPTIWLLGPVTLCRVTWPISPPTDELNGLLALAASAGTTRRVRFQSDYLTAHMEAMARRGNAYGFYGYLFRTNGVLGWVMPTSAESDQVPALVVSYFVGPSPEPAKLAAAASGPHAVAHDPATQSHFHLDRARPRPFNSH